MTKQPPSTSLPRFSHSFGSIRRIAFFVALSCVCMLLSACLVSSSLASPVQDNPFGADAVEVEPEKQVIKLKSASDVALESYLDRSGGGNELIIRSVRLSNPTTPVALAKAVTNMMNIKEFGEAKSYLAKLVNLKLDPKATYELYVTVGPDFFYTLNGTNEMRPEGQEFARASLAAAKAYSESPDRLNQLIKKLSDTDINIRSDAFNKLRRLGPSAAAAIINVFADDSRMDEFAGLRGALYKFGDSAVDPLIGGSRATNARVSAESIRALTRYSTPEALDVLSKVYLSPNLSEPARRTVVSNLLDHGMAPEKLQLESRLANRRDKFLDGAHRSSDSFLDLVTLWNWDDASKKLVPQRVEPSTAARVRAADIAADLYEIDPSNSEFRQRYLLTQFESAKRVSGASNIANVDALIEKIGRYMPLQPTEVEAVLEQAIKLDYIPAAITCCEILKKIGGQPQVVGGPQTRPLVRAILVGDRHLQFAALDAISTINPTSAYAGSSYVAELAVFLARSQNQSAALVGHIRPVIAQSYAGTLQALGINCVSAASSRSFFEKATTDPDLSIFIVTDTLDRPNYAELIQQLRNDWRTKRTPIAFMVSRTENISKMDKLIGKVDRLIALPMSTSPSDIASQVVRINKMTEPLSVSTDDRHRHSVAATSWLVKIASDPTYKYYNLAAHEDQLVQLLYIPEFSTEAAKILSELGTSKAQREIVNYASQTGLPIEARQFMAEAFDRSVKRQGTMLTTHEIEQQYDRFNASEATSEETRKVLGSILDSIEARRKYSRELDQQ